MPQLHNLRHEMFCEVYVKDPTVKLNATRSYMKVYTRASYNTALVNGPVLLGKTRNRIAELMEGSGLRAESVALALKGLLEAKRTVRWRGRIIAYAEDHRARLAGIKLYLRMFGIK